LPPKPDAVTANYINGNGLYTKGVDVDLKAHFGLPDQMRWESEFTGTDILTWKQDSGSGYVQFVGTHGPFNLSSGAGTPKYRASWVNTLVAGRATVTATVYYVSHEYLSIPDITGNGSCASVNNATGADFPANCTLPSFTYVDLNGSYHLTHDLTLFGGIDNLFNRGPGLDPLDYGAGLIPFGGHYNPTYQQAGIVGRFFELGVRLRL
jgi:iron complex outermembrane receptor protein